MEKNLTEIVFILDRSGSMEGLEADTIGGFNSTLKKQKKVEGEAFVTTILFDDRIEVIHDRKNIKDIKVMTEKDYQVGGSTALLDAVGGAIEHIAKIHKYARAEDVPKHTMFVIITDGMENASRKYTAGKIRKMIERKKKEKSWEFLFLGANIDAIETARSFGIMEDRAANYRADSIGTKMNYRAVNKAIYNIRTAAPLTSDWKKDIEDDYKKCREANEEERYSIQTGTKRK